MALALKCGLVDGEAVGVPTVPAHRRRWGGRLRGNEGGDEEDGGEKSRRNEGWPGHEERIEQRGQLGYLIS